MSDDKDRDYTVGYGRPPKHGRFRTGLSGNPRGRKKGVLNLKTITQRELSAKVGIREGGEVKRVSKLDAMVKSLVQHAMKGDPRALKAVFELADRVFGSDSQSAPKVSAEEDRRIIERFLEGQGGPRKPRSRATRAKKRGKHD